MRAKQEFTFMSLIIHSEVQFTRSKGEKRFSEAAVHKT